MVSLILDTNAFLRFLLNDIPDQADKVSQIISQAKQNKVNLTVPQIVIFEIIYVLTKFYKFPKDKIINKVGIILKSPHLNIQDQNIFQQALEMYEKQNLSFVDCFLISMAKEQNQQIFTFDQELVKLLEKV